MRIVILGNSGSGKSTLARWLAARSDAPLLDLDTLAWEPGQIAVARPAAAAVPDVQSFCSAHTAWVVEGCYADLIRAALAFAPVLIFLDPGAQRCLANCRSRAWEPHKYASKAAQDERLAFLLTWVRAYYARAGELSHAGHVATYEAYRGSKQWLRQPPLLDPPAAEVLALLA
jgi:adenylate kinase family enzyme